MDDACNDNDRKTVAQTLCVKELYAPAAESAADRYRNAAEYDSYPEIEVREDRILHSEAVKSSENA